VALLVWLQGIANLVGLKEDQILSTVVPIAMIAFGVDYAFHAVGRYREERADGVRPRPRSPGGWAGSPLRCCSRSRPGVFAFLANVASGIESITQFGIAAAIALVSAFVVLGVVVPVPSRHRRAHRRTDVRGATDAAVARGRRRRSRRRWPPCCSPSSSPRRSGSGCSPATSSSFVAGAAGVAGRMPASACRAGRWGRVDRSGRHGR
jgi:hypothetical protein